ncbi:helix-turn-helix domain-containing protein [Dendrosporobacter sp. 1207_IL3150]|uniref:helix-turn-helix domain-containing protein n=1 Tax=Dendrosporobacter sp. 1207_IL3150 TaxID=3084054 RepID=UPI002FDA38EF
MSGKIGMKHYSIDIKQQAVKLHIEDGLTIRQVTTLLGIVDKDRVKKWCAMYRKDGMPGLLRPKGRPRKRKQSDPEHLEDELKRLRMENDLLRNFRYEAERR